VANDRGKHRAARPDPAIRITLTFTWGVGVVVGLGIILLVLFLALPDQRGVLRFVLGLLATGGGVVGAYYVGRGLRANADSQMITRTFEYPARWGDPTWAKSRDAVVKLLKELQGKPEIERLALIDQAIGQREELEAEIRIILNFLEQVALAVNLQVVDEAIIDRLYRTMVIRTYGALAPWVKRHRDERDAPRFWVEVEGLYDRWVKD
jgi:hypothetical protein